MIFEKLIIEKKYSLDVLIFRSSSSVAARKQPLRFVLTASGSREAGSEDCHVRTHRPDATAVVGRSPLARPLERMGGTMGGTGGQGGLPEAEMRWRSYATPRLGGRWRYVPCAGRSVDAGGERSMQQQTRLDIPLHTTT